MGSSTARLKHITSQTNYIVISTDHTLEAIQIIFRQKNKLHFKQVLNRLQ